MSETSLAAALRVHAATHADARATPAPVSAAKPAAPRQLYYADGSAVPDVVAYHHRPEDLGDITNMDVPESDGSESNFFGKDGLTFGDVLDIINPLQHIPIVATIYRAITGDEISPGARLAGGALYGGPIGFAAATLNAVVDEETGHDVGETVLAALTGEDTETAPGTAVAAAKPEQPVTAPGAQQAAVAVADADPAAIGVPQIPVSLVPRRASAAQAKPAPLRPTAPLPFGGIGTMSNVPSQAAGNDPVAAILQARAAVPQAGPVPGLGNNVRTQRLEQTPLPSISPRLADKLAALAAQTGNMSRPAPDKAASPARPTPAFIPPSLVPQRMLDNLERYERMKQAARDGG